MGAACCTAHVEPNDELNFDHLAEANNTKYYQNKAVIRENKDSLSISESGVSVKDNSLLIETSASQHKALFNN